MENRTEQHISVMVFDFVTDDNQTAGWSRLTQVTVAKYTIVSFSL